MLIRITNLVSLVALTALLAACGGGSKSPAPPLDVFDPPFVFATPLSVTGAVGTTVNNPATGGGGTGAITYVSSNASVATVNVTTGVATLLTVGTTTITATKAASSGFNQLTASYTLTVTMGSQSIAFAQTGPLQVLKGFTLTNTASGGAGTGAITYASSTTNATVNPTSGVVTGVTAGSATITATKAADANYAQAQATYSVTVQNQAQVSAWVGASDSQVTVTSASGLNLIRSRDKNCVLANYSTCTSGQSDVVGALPITDTANTLTNSGYYWLEKSGTSTAPLSANVNRFSERIGHQVLFFNNRYWVIGGGTVSSANAKSDVWSSSDGKSWELVTSNAFPARWFHQAVVYNNKMWVVSGVTSSNGLHNDVWSSLDGVNWTSVSLNTPFSTLTTEDLNLAVFNGKIWAVFGGRTYSTTDGVTWTPGSAANAIDSGLPRGHATLTVYNNQLWYIGGARNYSGGSPTSTHTSVNEVWTSSDGVNWTKIVPTGTTFPARWLHASFVLNNRLWVFGGGNVVNGVGMGATADAYSTTDGLSWTAETLNTDLDRSSWLRSVQETNKVTLIGGVIRGYSNQVWQTTDGSQWRELSPYAVFSPRISQRAVEFLGDHWIIGGSSELGVNNEIWRSSDGSNWTRVVPTTPIFGPRSTQVVVFNNRIWVIGGWDDVANAGGTDTRTNDVWSSADGVSWMQHTQVAPFPARLGPGVAVFNGKIWQVGGSEGTYGSPIYKNDVWSSADGATWVQEQSSAAFTPRSPFQTTVAFNGALWMFGADVGGVASNEIWKSLDGKNWTLIAPVGQTFSARVGHAVTVLNNRVYLSGGWTTLNYDTSTRFNDVWSTSDGVTWTQNTANAQFSPRTYHSMHSHNNELWIIGGWNLDFNNDVWRSADGVNWRVGFNGTISAP